jgi:restriction system protein
MGTCTFSAMCANFSPRTSGCHQPRNRSFFQAEHRGDLQTVSHGQRCTCSAAASLHSPAAASFRLLSGRHVLANPPAKVDIKFLERFPKFRDFRSEVTRPEAGAVETSDSETPEEALDAAYQSIRAGLASELLGRVRSRARVLRATRGRATFNMGYGGAGGTEETIGKSGDEVTDGIIAEDRLGLEMVYLQAKRWEGTVGRPEIQPQASRMAGLGTAVNGRQARATTSRIFL